ncbi:MAG: class I SAM-dependent methyltransferase [Chloroflexi bacterium]|nr:MAG: class I SAM-dependent methyltransferase [Chloroflexota bacterium]
MWQAGNGQEAADRVGSHLPLLYTVEERHWWSRGMRAIALGLLDGVVLPPGAVLEIGCGGGNFLSALHHRWPGRPLLGLDLRWDALLHAKQRDAELLVRANLDRMPLAGQSCALVVALDVFDQTGVEFGQALSTCWSLLRPGGYLLLRVSALAWLSSPHDAAFGTQRRYSSAEIGRALEAAALVPLRLTYANSLLLPLIAAHRLLQQFGLAGVDGAFGSDGFLNSLGYSALVMEAAFLQRYDLPIGSSLFCLAQRPEEESIADTI